MNQLAFKIPINPYDESSGRLDNVGYVLDGAGMLKDIAEAGSTVVEAVSTLLEGTTIVAEGSGAVGFALSSLAVFTSYVSSILSIAGAHAAAKAYKAKEQLLSGLSKGIVLGGNDVSTRYVKWNFWMNEDPMESVYPGFARTLRNIHNMALAAGYAQAKVLSPVQKGNLYRDIMNRFSVVDSNFYSDVADFAHWSARDKIDYYILCSTTFRFAHLR